MPLPENIFILFYWTAPEGGFFLYGVVRFGCRRAQTLSARSRTIASVFAQPRQGSVMDLP